MNCLRIFVRIRSGLSQDLLGASLTLQISLRNKCPKIQGFEGAARKPRTYCHSSYPTRLLSNVVTTRSLFNPYGLTTFVRTPSFNERLLSTSSTYWKEPEVKEIEEAPKSPSIFQKFKKAYKEHGKVLVGVHVATSLVWYGSFYYIASSGVDVVGILERLGSPDWITDPLKDSTLGNLAVAYLMYKLVTPARYTVTLGGTSLAIKQMQNRGVMQAPPVKVRDLIKEGSADFRDRVGDRVDVMKDRVGDRVDVIKDRVGDRVDNVKDRLEDGKDKVKAKIKVPPKKR